MVNQKEFCHVSEKNVGILGAGMIVAEIALSFAMAWCEVVIEDQAIKLAKKGKARLGGMLEKHIQKSKYSADQNAVTLSRITPTDSYNLFKNVGLVVEADFENIETKKRLKRS